MTENTGLLGRIKAFWALLGVLLVVPTLAHAFGVLPAFIIASLYSPEALHYAVYAFIGWVVLYAFDTYNLVRFNDVEDLKEIFETAGNVPTKFFMVLAVYMNTIILIAIGIGILFDSVIGAPILGVIAAVIYPNLDLHVSVRLYSPGRLAVEAVLAALHAFGIMRDVTAEALIESLEGRATPH